MKRNNKSVLSVIAAAVFALVTGCASVGSADLAADEFHVDMPVDRGTGTF